MTNILHKSFSSIISFLHYNVSSNIIYLYKTKKYFLAMIEIFDEFTNGFSYNIGKGAIRLFHASKSGIQGPIDWRKSRPQCDFGQGFYLGNNEIQPKALVSNRKKPFFYEIEIALDDLSILNLDGLAWVLTVSYYRGKLDPEKHPLLSEYITSKFSAADIIVGPIADDDMFEVMRQFFKNTISWQAMLKCMSGMNIGFQYALKTDLACKAAKIISCSEIDEDTKRQMRSIRNRQKDEGLTFAEETIADFFGIGQNMRQTMKSIEKELENAKQTRCRLVM